MKRKTCVCSGGVGLFFILFFLAPVFSSGEGECADPGGQYVNPNNYLIVYARENYLGTSYRLPYETANTHVWNFYNDKMQNIGDISRGRYSRSDMVYLNIKSIKLHSYRHVTLFEGENYRGFCVKITRDLPNTKGLLMSRIKSLSVGRACSDRMSKRRFWVSIDNTLVRKIRYRAKVNGRWEGTYTEIKRKSKASRNVDSNQIVEVELQFNDLGWRRLCSKSLLWNRNNYITVRKQGRNFICDLKH